MTQGNPLPIKFYESPKHAQMVKAGTLPKLEDRMVHPEDIYVFAGPDELGVYGGTNRITSHSAYSWLGWNFTGGMGTCYSEDTDRLQSWPNGCKQATVSEDGSIYTIELRRNYHWSDGVPITMRDVEFAWELNYDKELNPKPFDKITDPVTGNVPKFVVVDDHTYQLQFDTAYWAVIEGQALRGRIDCNQMYDCHLTPFHYFKEYHPKYADAAEFKKKMEAGSYEKWTQVWKGKSNSALDPGLPSVGQLYISEEGENFRKATANPYFHGFAPDGSRVPGSGVRGRGSGERETTASSLAGKQQAREKEDTGGQGKDGPAGAIAQGGNGR